MLRTRLHVILYILIINFAVVAVLARAFDTCEASATNDFAAE